MDKKNISILLVGTQMATGGAQKVLLDQAGWFHVQGHKVSAVFFYDKENLRERWQSNAAFPIINLEAFRKGAGALTNAFSLIGGLFRLWKLIRHEKPQVVEMFTHDSNMLVLPLAWLAGVPVRIPTHHGIIDGFPRWRERIHAWMVNHLSNGIVTVSDLTMKKALEEGIQKDKISVIPNGISPVNLTEAYRSEIRRQIGAGENDVVLLSVGRLVYQKAHEYLVSAMPAVLKEASNVKAGICGDGLLRAELETQIQSLGLEKEITLFGMQANVTKYLAAADVFVLPSRWEGLPIALLEAMSAGLPVIATRVEGVDEVVEEGVQGVLVKPESTEELVKAILQLSKDATQRHRMGDAARLRVLERYTVDSMCEQYLTLFEQRLGEGKTREAQNQAKV
jgi:glycosyltransferase involved in cell wall biosynthesis